MMKGGKNRCGKSWFVWILVIIGAINWGLVGIGAFFGSNWNVVNLIFGSWSALEWIIYILVGIAGVIAVFDCKCKKCMMMGGDMNMKQGGNMQGGQQM